MKLKAFVDNVLGLRLLLEELPLASGVSWRFLLEQTVPEDEKTIKESYSCLDYFLHLDESLRQKLVLHLSVLHDITNTIVNLQRGKILDDIELYEIKHLSYLSIKISEILQGFNIANLDVAQKAFSLLDPYINKQDSFYVYDIYDEKLAEYRRTGKIESALEEERKVLGWLSSQLEPLSDGLLAALRSLLTIDVIQAKAVLFSKFCFTRPLFRNHDSIKIKGMFNLYVRTKVGRRAYQSNDISLNRGTPSFLIGMNMGGKTVTLNTVLLVQIMAQMGFGCPAEEVETEVCAFLSGFYSDNIEKKEGNSSFANELVALNEIISSVEHFSKAEGVSLIVVDEPARTTNPTEGAALVQGFVDTIRNNKTYLLVATHYNIQMDKCMFLRVKGLTNAGIDYHIEEVNSTDVPNEAIAVAEMLKVSEQWIENSKKYLANA